MKRLKKGQGIAWLVAFVVILGLLGYYAATVITGTIKENDDSLKLGLDLDGGVSITYEAVGDKPTDEQMADTILKLQQRIENDLGEESATTEANVYRVGDDRITVEIPGVSDANALLEELGTPGTLYFIAQKDSEGNENYSYGENGYELNYDIETLTENGSVICTGKEVTAAQGRAEQDKTTSATKYVVTLQFNDEGTKAFGDATTVAAVAGETIGIYYDGKFVSVPKVNEAITTGNCEISGMSSMDEAEKLASYIRIGGLDIELQELESQVVGAQLGADALRTSLIAAGIGLGLVMIFLIVMYLVPGLVSSLALALYTAMLIGILKAFDITLTLPGIAGMILSIGMAVDANVIVFARVREEIKNGRPVVSSIEAGFSKALSAILDGNITTLIAAAVLGILGSGSVKGFAITLALGVVLSMFTALVITRILINSFYALGVRDAKFYGKAKEPSKFDFVGKKAIFITISVAIIAAGFITMGAMKAKTGSGLNYSLEFLGGTSTTVDFNETYSLADLDAKVVPQIASTIGVSEGSIQTTTVDGSNQAIFKTRNLTLEERESLNEMFESQFQVKDTSITQQTIGSTISGEMRSQSTIAVLVAVLCMLVYIWFRFKDIRFASSAIIALVHDVLVVLALYAFARISVGAAFIACMLTVIGYSVNDTIVVFDRIRENHKAVRTENAETLKALCNESLAQTLSRSISTSITTAIMVLMLLILGVSSIREFALPLLAGVIAGTYSSIFIATQLWYILKLKFASKN
ncbi:SecD/SecF fusion protein [Pseudobutyrivibrio sp. 49]|uniref:protein translocase subunit SecD n=1 Tax=unclassified Pseudobutyrivibrio TaxID=2638619 RepID=UPI00088B01D8|nr:MULTISPECIES: protein translocase subunit SecD [unclassified Pseudobutyrivibrio]SDI70161.1 SecD/SecF fusion protein [Pseudobutyrivibrio sp. 49]SFO31057.1 SecD/SecF fusion protein [Pseudobutyrivibrio sp. UC1225]